VSKKDFSSLLGVHRASVEARIFFPKVAARHPVVRNRLACG